MKVCKMLSIMFL